MHGITEDEETDFPARPSKHKKELAHEAGSRRER
jgi:hypothetical protein